jgi:hypothetical protein
MAKDTTTENAETAGDGEGELDELVEIDESELDAELDPELDGELDEDEVVLVEADEEDDDAVLVEEEAEEEEGPESVEAAERRKADAEDDDIEIVNEDDVEESLDEILKSRMVVEDEQEDDEGVDAEDRSEKPDAVLPKQADEFRCTNCFLIKKISQLADSKRQLCRDCV